jgi:hypothetical protein
LKLFSAKVVAETFVEGRLVEGASIIAPPRVRVKAFREIFFATSPAGRNSINKGLASISASIKETGGS